MLLKTKFSVYYRGVTVWNSLSEDSRNAKKLQVFKTMIKSLNWNVLKYRYLIIVFVMMHCKFWCILWMDMTSPSGFMIHFYVLLNKTASKANSIQ